ncbi:class I SAM-dependent methyltransferase [Planktomarina sp.]|nr:class I SAM-dependent methyltransferase [Planktomarina sp.]
MRITYRNQNVKNYWEKRWQDIPVDQPMENHLVYPLKFAEKIIRNPNGKILEAGCGAGRIVRYYHKAGLDITGFDFVEVAITKLKNADPTLKVEVGDITALRFADNSFKYVLAFGLYHNLEHGLSQAIEETHRVLEPGGSVCASFRADNIQTKLTDWLTELRTKKHSDVEKKDFHKVSLTHKEFKRAFEAARFVVESIEAVENMPILYKFSIFRAPAHKVFDENIARAEGYKLSKLGQLCQTCLMYLFPNQFCNVYVLIGHKTT